MQHTQSIGTAQKNATVGFTTMRYGQGMDALNSHEI